MAAPAFTPEDFAAVANMGARETAEVRACRQCSVCEGQDHHWMYVGDEDEAGEPVISCKHCEATRPIQDDDE